MTTVTGARTSSLLSSARVIATFAACAGVFLAGCESNGSSPAVLPEASVAPPPPKLKTVAVYPVLAAPAPLNKQLQDGVADAIDKTKYRVVTVADGSTPSADYQLRGYGTASKDKTGAKFAYFFDVLDGKGDKINRIAGEEPLGKVPAKTKDLWPRVTPDIVKSASAKTAASFATTVTGAVSAPTGQPAPAATLATATPPDTTATSSPPATTASTATVPTAPTTPAGPLTVAVVPVTGALGDGNKTLTAALEAELKKRGLTVVSANAPSTYKVQGKVTTVPNEQGQEDVKIAWDVKDANGGRLATVSQGNAVEKGALSDKWGATANEVAAAASLAIMPLLRKDGTAVSPASGTAPGKQASVVGPAVR